MSVRRRVAKDGSASWNVQYRDGGKQRTRTFPTKREADAFDAEVKRRKRDGAFAQAEPSSMTLGDWAEQWLVTHGGEWAPTTYRQRVTVLERWVARPTRKGAVPLADVQLRNLGRERILEWRGEVQASGVSARHVNGIVRVLSSCLGQAVKAGLIPWNPCATFGALGESLVEREGPADADVARIIEAMPTSRDKAVAALMAYAGLRPAEAAGVQATDVGGGVLHVQRSVQDGEVRTTKTKRPRNIRIREPLAAVLGEHRAGTPWLAPGDDGGPLDMPWWTRTVWKPVVRELEVRSPAKPARYATPYELRYAFARRVLRDERLDLVAASVELGHSVKVLSDTYTRYIT